jgi:hypothetical protein
MSVDLSRQVARLMPFIPLSDLTFPQRSALSIAVNKATVLTDLSSSYQAMIKQAKNKVLNVPKGQ